MADVFRAVSAVEQTDDGRFRGDIHPDWTIGSKPNGGYLLAMMARAALDAAGHDHVISASTHYLHSPDPGPVTLEATTLRKGRTADHVRVTLSQDDRPCVDAVLMIGRFEPATGPYWDAGLPPVPQVGDDALRVPGTTPTGTRVAIMDQVEIMLDRSVVGFGIGHPSGAGVLRGTLALPGGAAFDPVSLLYAVDAFPPATFEIEPTGWVPTLEMTVYVRALPAPGPVTILHEARLVEAQRVDEATFVWDSEGRFVAQATQLAGIRLG